MTELITPAEYAILVYDMFSIFIVENFKKIRKEELEGSKAKMDMEIIGRFSFPAPFDKQRYSADTGGVEKRTINFVVDETSEEFIFKDKYLERYGF